MKKNRLKKDVYTNYTMILQIGIHMLTPIFLCVAIGVLIDKRYNTYLTLPLLILGILAGCRNAYVLAKQRNQKTEAQLKLEEEQRMVNESIEKWNEGKQFYKDDTEGDESEQ